MFIFIREPGKDDATDHIFVEDTLDGGLADHFRTDNGKEVKRFEGWVGSKEIPIGWKSDKIKNNPDVEKLPFFCRCKTIRFYLTRAKEKKDGEGYWIVPGEKEGDPLKFVGVHCLCTDCRLASGNLISNWIEGVPRENVIDSTTDSPVVLQAGETKMKGLKVYESSPGTYREFCETCGATVFYWKGKAPEKVCIGAGLVDEEVQGVRAEKWLKWHEEVFHGKDAMLSYAEADLVDGTKKTNEGK